MRQRLFALTLVIVVAAILAVLYLALRPPASGTLRPSLPTETASREVKADAPLASANLPAPAGETSPDTPAKEPVLPADRSGGVLMPGLPRPSKKEIPEAMPSYLDVTLKGQVVDVAGRPVANAEVHIAGAVSADKYLRKGPSKMLAVTGLDGSFEGKYSPLRGSIHDVSLYAEVARLKSESLVVSVLPGDTYDGILIKLPQTGSITGCVVDVKQRPIPNARVSAGFKPQEKEGEVTLRMGTYHPFFTTTDANGCFALNGLPPGEYEVDGAADDFHGNQVDATVRAGEITDLGFSLFLAVPIYLKAQLQCPTRPPKGQLTITFIDAEGRCWDQREKASDDGLLSGVDIPFFSTVVIIHVPGYLPTERLQLPAPSEDNVVDLGKVTLVASGEIPAKDD